VISTSTVQTLGSLPLVLGDGLFLVSFWKPIILLIPLAAWAWLIASVFDKHAARFFLPRQQWNLAHLIAGFIAFAAAVAFPAQAEWGFWVGLTIMLVILSADVAAFMIVANKDERVPVDHHLKLDLAKLTEARAAKAAAKQQGKATLVITASDKSALHVPQTETPEFALRLAAEALYLRAIEVRASQIDIAPTGKDGAYAASFLVDGLRQTGQVMPQSDALKLIDLWKAGAKLDVNDRRRRLVGDMNVDNGAERHKLRLTTIGASTGQRLTMVVDPEKAVQRKPAELGLLEQQMADIKAVLDERQGVVLLAAPLDGGRTTTLYTLVKMHDAYTQNVQTVEIEPQDSLEGVRQNKFDPQAEGAEFGTLVRSILRRDPDVVGIAELPDAQTAGEIARADQDRTRTYVSLKADSALVAVQMWTKAVGDPDKAGKVLRAAIAQKLMRKLCINCRLAYQPSGDMLKKLGLPADKVKQLFKKGGQVIIKNKNQPETCPVCQGVGYIGQEGAFEVYKIGDEERAMIKAGNWNGLRAEFRKKGSPTIQQTALRKAIDGVTSVEEVMRITAESGGEAGGGAQPQAAKPKPVAPAGTPIVAKPASA
jgi:type II secretory ATPase GspE/PulE/Tfp pilus assembly ATPase PilB-like protein